VLARAHQVLKAVEPVALPLFDAVVVAVVMILLRTCSPHEKSYRLDSRPPLLMALP
jgi:hypothetical protein